MELDPVKNYLHSYRWIKVTDGGDNTFNLPTHTQEQFEFIQKLLLELIESGEYDAALHADPQVNPEIEKLRTKFEQMDEDEEETEEDFE